MLCHHFVLVDESVCQQYWQGPNHDTVVVPIMLSSFQRESYRWTMMPQAWEIREQRKHWSDFGKKVNMARDAKTMLLGRG